VRTAPQQIRSPMTMLSPTAVPAPVPPAAPAAVPAAMPAAVTMPMPTPLSLLNIVVRAG
jgi:hypothetical protein